MIKNNTDLFCFYISKINFASIFSAIKLTSMKVLRMIVLFAALLLTVPLVMAIFMSREYTVEREIVINKPKQDVFSYIRTLKNQDQYNVWWRLDPNVKKDFRGTDGTVGFVAAWDGNKHAGKGEQEITKIVEGELLACDLRFQRPFEGSAKTTMYTETVSGNQTKLRWVFNGKNGYPMNFMNFAMDKFLGKDLQASITGLKAVIER